MRRAVVYGFLLLALVGAYGWVRPILEGPEIRFSTFSRTKVVPVPVQVETVKWLTKVKRERVEVPLEVIRAVTPPQDTTLHQMGVSLPALHAEGKELVDVVDVPRAPYGGSMALVVDPRAGRIEGTFLPKPAPRFELGGIREAGVEVDPLNAGVTGFYRQEFLRAGRYVVSGRAYATAAPKGRSAVGATIGVAVRF